MTILVTGAAGFIGYHLIARILSKNKKVIGILSERDLSRFIYAEKFNLTLPVSELMSKSLVTCDLNTSVTELMDEMTEKKIRHILIMEDQKLLGKTSQNSHPLRETHPPDPGFWICAVS